MLFHQRDRGHRTQHARTFLIISFVLQRIGDAAVIWFTYRRAEPALLLRGLAIGSVFSTVALFVGVFRRLRWARYVLTTVNWAYMAVLSFRVLNAWNDLRPTISEPYLILIVAVSFYAGATLILVRSRRVRHFANK